MPVVNEKWHGYKNIEGDEATQVCVHNTVIWSFQSQHSHWFLLLHCVKECLDNELDRIGPHWTTLDRIGPHWTTLDHIGPGPIQSNWTRVGPNWTNLDQVQSGLIRVLQNSKFRDNVIPLIMSCIFEEMHQRGQHCIYRCRLMCVLRRSNQNLATASAAKKRPS